MIDRIDACATLNNGVKMPWLGLGVFRAEEGKEVVQAVQWALERGYRSIDTASIYGNEAGVGEGVRRSGIARDQIFVTTKVWNGDQGYDAALSAFDASLERLKMDYVDLYLIHWPVKGKYKDTWRALEQIYRDGRAKAVGVSNFLVHHLEDLERSSELVPAANQVEFHPRLQQPDLQAYCRKHGIVLTAWSPIMKGRVNDVPELVKIAAKYGKTPVQLTLRWEIQLGVVTIPKSVHKERIDGNADIFDFEISPDDMAAIDALDRNERIGPHPDHIDF